MMEFKNKIRSRGLVSFLSMMLVAVLCFTLTVQATTAAPDQPVGGQAVVGKDQVESTDPDAEKQVEDQPAAVTAEAMAAAWDALLAELTAAQQEAYGKTIDAAKADEKYVREDLYKAVQLCTECLLTQRELDSRVNQTISRIENSADLTQEQKTQFLDQIDTQLYALGASPLDTLMADVTALLENDAAQLHTNLLEAANEEMKTLRQQILNLDDLLAKLALVPALEAEVGKLSAQFATSSSKAGAGEAALFLQTEGFAQRCKEIRESIDGYFALPEDRQVQLPADIQALADEVAYFTPNTLINAVKTSDTLAEELEAVAQAAEQVQTLQLLLYVALGVAALSLIMGVVAAIMAAAKSRDKDIDLSVFSTREDDEALQEQNKALKKQCDQQEQKQERMRLELERMRQELDRLAQEQREVKPEPKVVPKPEPKVEPVPAAEPVLGSQEEVCRLNMVYNHFNPRSSYLEVSASGAYVLYADNTIELSAQEMTMSNRFKSWTNNGLLFLFDVEVNGKILDAERDTMPDGFYAVEKTLRRACVSKLEQNRYMLQFRGVVRMKNA